MADALVPRSALDGFKREMGGVSAREVEPAILALAVPLGGDEAFAEALRTACGVERPQAGRAARTADGGWIAAVQADQLWLLDTNGAPLPSRPSSPTPPTPRSSPTPGPRSSSRAQTAEGLSATCSPASSCSTSTPPPFPSARSRARSMEHMGVVILREEDSGGASRFLLLAPRSFAGSFAHAVETSLHNAAPRQN